MNKCMSPHRGIGHSKVVSKIYKYIDFKCLIVNLGNIYELECIFMELVDICLYENKNMDLKYFN